MKKFVAATATSIAFLGAAATAHAETLSYDFTMEISELYEQDPANEDVFGDLEVGDTIQVHVDLATGTDATDGDGDAFISVQEVSFTVGDGNSGSNAVTWTQGENGSEQSWNVGSKTTVSKVNTVELEYSTLTSSAYLVFTTDADGNLVMGDDSKLELIVSNGTYNYLRANNPGEVTSGGGVPELSGLGGMGAGALLFGLGLVFSGRRRRSA